MAKFEAPGIKEQVKTRVWISENLEDLYENFAALHQLFPYKS